MTKVESLNEYLDIIKDYEIELYKEGEKNKTLYFRGETKTGRALQPSIFREKELLQVEDKLFFDMQRLIYKEFQSFQTTLDKLVFMQHHGLPTRLLDITANPLVSLYFACEKYHNENDGIVYILPQYEEDDSDNSKIISLLSRLPQNFTDERIKELIFNELNREAKEIDFLKFLEMDVSFIKTNRNNNRQINQDGDFLLFSNNTKIQEKQIFSIDKENMECPPIIISKNSKKDILNELNRIGINLFTLFPEPEKLSKYLVDKYKDNNIIQTAVKLDNTELVLSYLEKFDAKDVVDLIEFINDYDIFNEEHWNEFLPLAYNRIGIHETDELEKYIHVLNKKEANE